MITYLMSWINEALKRRKEEANEWHVITVYKQSRKAYTFIMRGQSQDAYIGQS